MKKSSKRSSKKNQTMKLHRGTCCEATFDGIQMWYKEKFEKLGWMILAKEHGYSDKIAEYKSSLRRLKQAMEHKMTHVTDSDRKHDLMIMYDNLKILMTHVNADFQKGGMVGKHSSLIGPVTSFSPANF
jgi:hypothetical protein